MNVEDVVRREKLGHQETGRKCEDVVIVRF